MGWTRKKHLSSPPTWNEITSKNMLSALDTIMAYLDVIWSIFGCDLRLVHWLVQLMFNRKCVVSRVLDETR